MRIFTEILQPDQTAALGSSLSPETLARSMSAKQKETARLKLKDLEKSASDDQLPKIQRGYQLLGFANDGLRVDLMRQGR